MVSGSLLATLFSFTVLSGAGLEVKSFVIVVLGTGNPPARCWRNYHRLLESITTIFIPVSWSVFEFVVFI